MSFVEVLPLAPVTATTVASMRDRSSAGELQQRLAGRSHGHRRHRRRRARRAPTPPRRRSRTPPARTARRRCARRAARRTARPGTTSRESIATDDTSTSVPRNSPSTARATSVIRRGFMRGSPSASSSSRATTRSSNGIDLVPELLVRLVALAGDRPPRRPPPPREAPAGSPRGGRARPRTRRPPPSRPVSISAMMASGSSDRGLSVVTTLRSAFAVAAAPIRERFARSRSPPQPNTRIRRPDVSGRDARSTLRMLSGVCA